MQNPVPERPVPAPVGGATPEGVVSRITQRTLASRGVDYSTEVRRLLDAGREVMRRSGTDASPKVADIVAEAGLSNDAFYRHFASKDELVGAILEDGTERLVGYLAHQVDKVDDAAGKVRVLVEGVLSQAADPEIAATTRAVWWNAGGSGRALASPGPASALGVLLEGPIRDLGIEAPAARARLVAHALIGALSDHLRDQTSPTADDVERVAELAVSTPTTSGTGRRRRAAARR